MAGELEAVLSRLLLPDNSAIQQATEELKQIYKNPNIVPALCGVVAGSQNPQIRQYAAVLLRRKVAKQKQWRSLPRDICENIRENLLKVLVNEPEKLVRYSVAQVVATVAKHDLPSGQWPQMLEFLQQYTKSANPQERQMGMFVLSTMSKVTSEQLKPLLPSLLGLFSTTLEDSQSRQVQFYTLQAMTNLAFQVGSDETNQFQILIPKAVMVIRHFIHEGDEDKACEAMELFDELVECEVTVVVPHVKLLVEFCLEVASSASLGDNIRVKALSFISWLTRLRKRAIIKHKLVKPTLNVLFPLMCTPPLDPDEEDEDDEVDYGSESSTPGNYAAQVLDTLALHLPAEKLMPLLLQFIEPSLQSSNPYERKAAYIALAVIAEGCSERIKTKHLEPFLDHVSRGTEDPNPVVANAAMYALGQFAEHLQPKISKFAASLLPLLFANLERAAASVENNSMKLTKTFYALETFCENLEKDILPMLPAIMEKLLSILTQTTSVRMKELAISSVGAVANAAKESMVPYFPAIIEQLKVYLASPPTEELMAIQLQAIDTLGVFARTLGDENFRPLANECIELGLKLWDGATDPDLRRCIYGLFAAISTLLKTDFSQYLPNIVPNILESLRSTEGVTAHFAEEDSKLCVFVEEDIEDEEENEDEDSDDNIQGFSVENAYLDEKEDSCVALGDIAASTGAAFMPYIEESFQEVFKFIDHPASDVKKGAVTAMGQFCVAVHKAVEETNSAETQQVLSQLLCTVVPKLLGMSKNETDRLVVMATLQTLEDMLNRIGEPVLHGDSHLENVVNCVKDVLQLKMACQEDSGDEAENDDQAEYDQLLIEHAGDIIPILAKILGGEQFMQYFVVFLPELMKKLKKKSEISEKSFAIGTLAETCHNMGSAVGAFVDHLYPIFLAGTQEEDEELRGNSVFGMGVLASSSGEKLIGHYPDILKLFFNILSQESEPRVVDNICAAVCRMVWTKVEAVPLEQVLPVVLQCLPLKDDMDENNTVYPCLVQLYANENEHIMNHLQPLLGIFAHVLGTDQIKPEIQAILIQTIQNIHEKHNEDFQKTVTSLPPELAEKINMCLQLR